MKSKFVKQPAGGTLVKAVKMALAGTLLVTGVSHAVLRDHGPSNPVVGFPDWYRDFNGLVLGQCVNADDAGNGPLCLTGPADAVPNAFPGNIGEEAFYSTADIEIPISGGSFLWLGHLEMAYGSATGEPPAVRNANTPATEIVFSRERMRFDVPTTNDGSCAGTYTIRTPFKVHELELEEGARSLFYTDDIQPINGNYSAALEGHAGPFLTWNVGQDGVSPVSAANPAVTVTPPVGAVRKYVGDPNVPHLFVGSTLPAGPGHLDKEFNNYVEITPPAACDLGAGAGVPLFEENAAISGLIWDLPIADPVTITKATYSRNAASVGLDVWATASKNQKLVLTAANSNSQHVPSTVLDEEVKAGSNTGFYHAHLEFASDQNLPEQISVANMSSNPVATDKAAVVDEIVVTKSTYDTDTRVLCIAAHSGDEVDPRGLSLEAPSFGAFTDPTGSCPGVAANDKVLEKDLDSFSPDALLPPEGILIRSSIGGRETSQPSISRTGTLNALNSQAVDDKFENVQGTGATSLNLVQANPTTADTPPASYRIVLVDQPEIGAVTAPASGGTVTYQAVEGMEGSTQVFHYAILDTTNDAVSNVARVELKIDQVIAPPTGVQDLQGVLRTSTGSVISVLTNDVVGPSNSPIDIASIQIATPPTRGTATPNPNGTITYVPVGQGGTLNNTIDTFTYTVANQAGSRSAPITVQISLKTAAEALAFQRVRWTGSRWDIRLTSTYAGPAGAITLAPAVSCTLEVNGAGGQIGSIASNILPAAGTNTYQVGGTGPAAVGNNWRVRCTTSSGGTNTRTGTL